MGNCCSAINECLKKKKKDNNEESQTDQLGSSVRHRDIIDYHTFEQKEKGKKKTYINTKEAENHFKLKKHFNHQNPQKTLRSKQQKLTQHKQTDKKQEERMVIQQTQRPFNVGSSKAQVVEEIPKKKPFSKKSKESNEYYPPNNLYVSYSQQDSHNDSSVQSSASIQDLSKIIQLQPGNQVQSQKKIGNNFKEEIINHSEVSISSISVQMQIEPSIIASLSSASSLSSLSSSEEQIEQIQQSKQIEQVYADQQMYNKPEKLVGEPLLSHLKTLEKIQSKLVDECEQFPYNKVGCIKMQLEKGAKRIKFFGSGVVVGPRYVHTACHNLYSFKEQQKYSLKYFELQYRHFNELPQYGRTFKIKSSFGHIEQFKRGLKDGNYSGDYAFLELDTDQDLEQFSNFRFGLELQDASEEKVMISYPLSKENSLQECSEAKGQTFCQNNHIYHQFDVGNGSSGGPIFQVLEGEYYIIGLHSGNAKNVVNSLETFECRVGPQFTDKILGELVEFMANSDGRVDLKNKQIGNKGCQILANALKQKLTHLNLTNNKVGTEACNQLIRCNWPNLIHLNLSNNLLSSPQAFSLLKKIRLPRLKELILVQNRFSAECCKHLIQAHFPTLQILNLGYNNVGDDGCEILSHSTWPTLKKLYLLRLEQYLSQGVLLYIPCRLASTNFHRSSYLNVNQYQNMINAEGCKYFAQSDWKHLAQINLDKNIIGDQGCFELSKAEWTNLQKIHLWRNSITKEGATSLLKGSWKNLMQINLGQNSIENPEVMEGQFLNQYPNVDIALL